MRVYFLRRNARIVCPVTREILRKSGHLNQFSEAGCTGQPMEYDFAVIHIAHPRPSDIFLVLLSFFVSNASAGKLGISIHTGINCNFDDFVFRLLRKCVRF